MKSKISLPKNCVKFKLADIPMIGNVDTGSLAGLTELGENLISNIENGTLRDLDTKEKEIIKTLLENRFLQYDEYDSLNKEKSRLNVAYVHVTNNCNLNCVGCYSLNETRNKEKDLSLENFKVIFDNLQSMGIKSIIISGGEPFLRNDLDQVLKSAKDYGINIQTLITNGTIVSKENLKKIAPYVNEITISVDGFDDKTTYIRDKGIFSNISKSIDLIKKSGIKLSILPTIHKKNVYNIDNYVQWAKKLDIGISFSILTCDDSFKEYLLDDSDLAFLINYIIQKDEDIKIDDTVLNYSFTVRKTCGICDTILSVASNGDIFPCHMLHYSDLKIGNVLKDSLQSLIENSEIWNKCSNLNVKEFETCASCDYKYLCGGGCRARSYFMSGNLTSKDSYCKMNELYFQNLAEIIAQNFK